jgi:16S rRNA (cytosine967-C5)-methyltransferase
MAEQDAILLEAARFVRPGGRLVYVTCSVFPAENETRIDALLARTSGLVALDHGQLWQDAFGGHGDAVHFRRNGLALSPLRTGTDGFFVSALTRLG